MSKKFWTGIKPTKCDVCTQPLVGSWIDGKTTHGPWANMCHSCHAMLGIGLGLGCGQMYSVETGEKLSG